MVIPKQQQVPKHQQGTASNNTLTDAAPTFISIYAVGHSHPAQPFNNMDVRTMERGEGRGVDNGLDRGRGVGNGLVRERVDIVVHDRATRAQTDKAVTMPK